MTPRPMTFKNKRRAKKSSTRYLKPGALAQLRYDLSTARYCTDIRKKRVVLNSKEKRKIGKKRKMMDHEEKMNPLPLGDVGSQSAIPAISPSTANLRFPAGPLYEIKQIKLHDSPRTPSAIDSKCHSGLESLPTELLVKILCHLHHDQLRAVFHVSRRIRSAVIMARQTYFNYTTPDRSRLEMLSIKTPLPTEHWPFIRDVKGRLASPHTPKAPRHGPRPPRFQLLDMKQATAVLFPDSTLPSKCMVLPRLSNTVLKPLASNRVLIYEDELCKAVAKNKLR